MTGKTGAEIRQLGVSGKLSITDLTNALLLSHSQNIEAVKEMPTTVRDALMAINNVWDDYLGRSNEAHGVTAMMSSGLVTLAENFNTVANIGGGVLAAAISLYLTNMGKAVVTSGMATVASAAHAVQELKTAQAQEAQAAVTLAQTRAMFGLTATHGQVAAAEAAHAAASARLAAAQAVLTNASRAAALALGPVGLALIVGTAAASFLTMRDASHEGAQALKDMQQPVKDLREEFRKLNDDQRAAQLVKWSDAAAEATKKAKASFQDLRGAIETEFTVSSMTSAYLAGMATETPVLTQYRAQLEAAMEAGKPLAPLLKEIGAASGIPESTINQWVKLAGAFADAQQQADNANKVVSDIKTNFYTLDGALDDLVSGPLFTGEAKITAPVIADPGLTKSAQEMINKLNEQTTLFGAATESAKVFYELQAGALVGLDPLMAEKLIKAAADLDAQKAAEEQQKKSNDALERYKSLMASLQTESEKANTQLRERLGILNNVKLSADEYAAAMEKVAKSTITDAPKYDGLDASVGGAASELGRVDNAQEDLQNWYDTQLILQQQFLDQKLLNEQLYADNVEQLNATYHERLVEIDRSRAIAASNINQEMLGNASNVFGSLADITGKFAGEQSGIYKTMFAISKGFSIAQSIIAIQTGIAQAAANPWPQNLAAMASVVSATAGIVGTIKGTDLQGIAHDGLPINRNEGTYLLRQDEMVLNPKQRDNFEYLVDYAKGGSNGNGGNQIHLTVEPTIVVRSESEVAQVQDILPQVVEATKIAVAEDIANRGMIWRASQ